MGPCPAAYPAAPFQVTLLLTVCVCVCLFLHASPP